jgi:hypothetical protein
MKPSTIDTEPKRRDDSVDRVERERWLDELITLDEAAAIRKISKYTLRRAGHAGRIKIYDVGRRALRVRRRAALMLD